MKLGYLLPALLCGFAAAILLHASAKASGRVERIDYRALDSGPARGPANAPVVIEVFFSPGQHQHRREFKAVEALQALHPTRIRLEYRIVRAGGTSRSHYAVLQAHAHGKFDAFMTAIRRHAAAPTNAQLVEIARSIGLDPNRFADALFNPPVEYDRILDASVRRLREKARPAVPPWVLINSRAPRTTTWSDVDLERDYRAALEQAAELIDRGAPPRLLPMAFDAQAAPNPLNIVVPTGATDSLEYGAAQPPRLATPALDLRGMPSIGPVSAAVTVAILCSPTSVNCGAAIRAARAVQEVYAEEVRLVWAPYFEHAAALGELSDALLCTESVAGSAQDFGSVASRGWRQIEAMLIGQSPRHPSSASEMLHRLIAESRLDPRALATCRAKRAGAAIAWIQHARNAGVRSAPSTILGGRIFSGLTDARTLQQLVDAELHPGTCDGCFHLAEYAPTWYR